MTYKNDPKWISAKFTSRCSKCKEPIFKGQRIFWYPKCKSVFCDSATCGQKEASSFNDAAQDEAIYSGSYYETDSNFVDRDY